MFYSIPSLLITILLAGGLSGCASSDDSKAVDSYYDAARAPIGDMTDIQPTKDVPSPTDGATCLAHLGQAIERARHGGAPVSILQYGDSHVARGVEPQAIEEAFKNIAAVDYHTMAKVGISAIYPLSDPRSWLDQPIKKANPDLIIIAFGSNDSAGIVDRASYDQTYQKLIDNIKERAPNASILMVGPADGDSISGANKGHTLPGLDTVVETQKALAKRNELDFFDLRQSMGGSGSIEDWHARGLAGTDKLHFTTQGYETIGKTVVQHLQTELDNVHKR